jgi:hypothetical protein
LGFSSDHERYLGVCVGAHENEASLVVLAVFHEALGLLELITRHLQVERGLRVLIGTDGGSCAD